MIIFITKLKKILNCKFFLFILFLSCITLTFYRTNIEPLAFGKEKITGIINEFSFNGDKLSMTINSEHRNIKVMYYIKDIDELDYLDDNILYGTTITLTGEFTDIPNNNIPNAFNYQKYLKSIAIYDYYKAESISIKKMPFKRYYLKNTLYIFLQQKKANYLYLALIMGNKNYFDTEELNLFNNSGLSHLLAISGLHLSIYLLIINYICKLFKIPKLIKNMVILIFLLFLLFCTNYTSSLIRVVIMYYLVKINSKYILFNNYLVIFYTFIFSLFFKPCLLCNIGFWYSIICAFVLLNYLFDNNKITKYFIMPLIIFLFTAPLSLYLNYEINLLAILSNIFFVPLFSVLMVVLFISLIVPFMSNILIMFYQIIKTLLLMINNIKIFTINIGYFDIHILFIIYLILFVFLKYRKKKIIILIVLILIGIKISYYLDTSYKIYYLDVGQGNCSIIVTPHHKEVMMIDTGGSLFYPKKGFVYYKKSDPASNIIRFLKAKNITTIDNLVITHGDYDHAGNANSIIKSIRIKNIIMNDDNLNDLEKSILLTARQKNIVDNDLKTSLNIELLKDNKFNNENDNSNVVLLSIYNKKLLYMGDAGIKRESDIIDNYAIENVDFINIGHHGSDTSTGKYFIDNIRPKNCIISVGKNNRYDHPKKEVIDKLKKCNIYRTDHDGSLEILINKKGYKIRTYIMEE